MSLSHCCRLFGISRQSVYQSEYRNRKRRERLKDVRQMVQAIRMQMPRLGTRKLYYLLKDEFRAKGLKLGRDALFDHLRSEHLLIRPKRNYTKTTNSKHWLKKHPNLLSGRKPTRPEEVFVSDITYVKSRERTHYLAS